MSANERNGAGPEWGSHQIGKSIPSNDHQRLRRLWSRWSDCQCAQQSVVTHSPRLFSISINYKHLLVMGIPPLFRLVAEAGTTKESKIFKITGNRNAAVYLEQDLKSESRSHKNRHRRAVRSVGTQQQLDERSLGRTPPPVSLSQFWNC